MRKLAIIALLMITAPCFAQERYLIDWDSVGEEALQHLSDLVQIQSVNPPGNETAVVEYVKEALAEDGIGSRLFWSDPARANLVTRAKGNGSKRPVLIMGHTDVVGVQADKWEKDPFGGEREDGWLYGRGSLDDKDTVAAGMIVMKLLKRHGIELDRDVIFLAESGEEGTPEVGIDYMVKHHWDQIAAEFVLAEGGGGLSRDDHGHAQAVRVQTTEKMIRRATLIARGKAGHGSRPIPDNAVAIIARAVARVSAWQTEVRLNETTRAYFQRLASISEPADAHRYANVDNPDEHDAISEYFFATSPYHHSVLRSTVTPTIIDAGFRKNVIPSEASAMLDIRMLPDEDIDAFYAQLAGIIDDPRVEIVPERVYRPAAPPSGIDNEMFETLERVAAYVYPGAVVLPSMSTGGTDMSQVRAMGVPAYGVGPIRSAAEQNSGNGSHSDNERVSEQAFVDFVRFLWLTIIDIAATGS